MCHAPNSGANVRYFFDIYKDFGIKYIQMCHFFSFWHEKSSFFSLGHRSVISGLRTSMFAPAHSRGALTPWNVYQTFLRCALFASRSGEWWISES